MVDLFTGDQQLEEGEIVDDDTKFNEFEDISEDSIIDTTLGKLPSPNANSLSSISDTGLSTPKTVRRSTSRSRKRKERKKRMTKCRNCKCCNSNTKKKMQKLIHQHETPIIISTSDSSDSETYLDKETLGQLKKAINISLSTACPRNSLRTKLRGMHKSGSDNDNNEYDDDIDNNIDKFEISQLHVVEAPIKTNSDDNIDDRELENLRMEALKTAVLNRQLKRKKRKLAAAAAASAVATQNLSPANPSDFNKENDDENIVTRTEEIGGKKPCLDAEVVQPTSAPPDLEDDEDILRASLLATLAKKIPKICSQIPEDTAQLLQKQKPLPIKIPAPSKLVLNNLTKKDAVRQPPVVKPLIICVTQDSDSDDNIDNKPLAVSDKQAFESKVPETNLVLNVERFLKEQRAQVEQKKPLVNLKKVKSPDVLEKSAVKLLPKSQQIEYQQLLKRLKTAEQLKRIKTIKQDKLKLKQAKIRAPSVISHFHSAPAQLTKPALVPGSTTLPVVTSAAITSALSKPISNCNNTNNNKNKNKIPEEKSVNCKLNNHNNNSNNSKKPNLCSNNDNNNNSKKDVLKLRLNNGDIIRRCSKSTQVVLPIKNLGTTTTGGGGQQQQQQQQFDGDIRLEKIIEYEKVKSGVINQLTTLQKILKDVRIQKNGSLQMKPKYQVLTTIMKKITETSNERKKHETRIKQLLDELTEARRNLSTSHKQFSTLVKELEKKKDDIDKSTESDLRPEVTVKIAETPKIQKVATTIPVNNNNRNINNVKNVKTPKIVTSTPLKDNTVKLQLPPEESPVLPSHIPDKNNSCEDMDVCSDNDGDETPIDIVDPNDIDQIFKRKQITGNNVPEYISPLNNYDRYKHMDPLAIICPYQVNGMCRDKDCTFKHFLKICSHTE